MNTEMKILENTVRTSFAGVVWSHKIQEKQADIYTERYKYLEFIRIIVSSITSCGVISLLFLDELWIKLISTFLSLIVVAISAIFKSFSMQELCASHKKAAHSLLVVRDKYQHLLMKIRAGQKTYTELDVEYAALEIEKHQAYAGSPTTTEKAVKLAKQALEIKKDNSYSDEEINKFLPDMLGR